MHVGAGKCTCQNACRDNHCLITLSSFSFLTASFLTFPKMVKLVAYFIHFQSNTRNNKASKELSFCSCISFILFISSSRLFSARDLCSASIL